MSDVEIARLVGRQRVSSFELQKKLKHSIRNTNSHHTSHAVSCSISADRQQWLSTLLDLFTCSVAINRCMSSEVCMSDVLDWMISAEKHGVSIFETTTFGAVDRDHDLLNLLNIIIFKYLLLNYIKTGFCCKYLYFDKNLQICTSCKLIISVQDHYDYLNLQSTRIP